MSVGLGSDVDTGAGQGASRMERFHRIGRGL